MYRASRDGFSADDFHTKCDGFLNTLTVIKTTNGNVLGGFTEYGINVYDPNAFIFSLINEENLKIRKFKTEVNWQYCHYAVYMDKDCGPSFEGNIYRI